MAGTYSSSDDEYSEDADQNTCDVADEEDEDCVGRSWGGDDEPELFRLSHQAILKNCDNMLPEWDYNVQRMNILWECNGCEKKLARHLCFRTDDYSYTGENWQLMDCCPNCCRCISVRADDSYNQPCTVGSVPYYGIMMSYWVVGATPIRFFNPPRIFTVTVVVDGVPHVLRTKPGPWNVSKTYNFMNLTGDRRPQVESFTLEFYDQKRWDKEVQELAEILMEQLAVEEQSDVEAAADDHESWKEDEEGKSESGSDND